jgi:hypothetical protein
MTYPVLSPSNCQAFVDAQGLDRLHEWMTDALAKKTPQLLVTCCKVLAVIPGG